MTISDAEFRRLKETVEILSGERGDSKKSQAALRQVQLQDVQRFITDVKDSAAAIRKNLEDLVGEVHEAQEDIRDLTARIGNAEDNLVILEDDLIALQGDVSALDGRIQTLQGQADDIEGQLGQAQQQITTVTGDLTNLQDTVKGVRDMISGIRTRVGAVSVPNLSSSTVAAPPTAAEYNALQGDVAAMRQALIDLKGAITA